MNLHLLLEEPTQPENQVLVHWIHLCQPDLVALAGGIVPEHVQSAAQMGCEHINDLLARLAEVRQIRQQRRKAKAPV